MLQQVLLVHHRSQLSSSHNHVFLYLLNIVWISACKTTRLHKINTEILWRWLHRCFLVVHTNMVLSMFIFFISFSFCRVLSAAYPHTSSQRHRPEPVLSSLLPLPFLPRLPALCSLLLRFYPFCQSFPFRRCRGA